MAESYEEIAIEIVKKNSVHWCGCSVCQHHRDQCVLDIAAALRDEREACAKICNDVDKEYHDDRGNAEECANRIRARLS